ncbi:MAG: RDD family protein [Verrucomicrobiota bacterium]
MEFYLSIDGEKQGPFSLFKVGELFEEKKIDEETLAWTRGQEEWLPIREVAALQGLIKAQESKKEREIPVEPPPLPESGPDVDIVIPDPSSGAAVAVATMQPRPFLRFGARMFDLMLVMTVVSFFVDTSYLMPAPDESTADWFARYVEALDSEETLAISYIYFRALIGWHLLEAVLIHLVGTTPGKLIFGVRVRSVEGGSPPFLRCLGRSVYVYLLGVGLYQFLLMPIGMLFSFFRIMTTGQCLWDQHLRFEVVAPQMNPRRIVLAITAFFVLVMLQSLKFT